MSAPTVDAAAAALAAEVVAITTQSQARILAAVGALATGEPPPAQAALDRVAGLMGRAIEQKQRHVSVRALAAAIDGRDLDLPILGGGA